MDDGEPDGPAVAGVVRDRLAGSACPGEGCSGMVKASPAGRATSSPAPTAAMTTAAARASIRVSSRATCRAWAATLLDAGHGADL